VEVRLAKNLGFCFGVKRAIHIAEEHTHTPTLGPLIHNKKEIERLNKDYGVEVLEDTDSILEGSSVIIRTHGIEKEKRKILEEKNVAVIDATCPYVTKPQQICEDMSLEGYQVIIYGDIDHPEVKGVKSYAGDGASVVLSLEEAKSLKLTPKVAIVSQTTKKISGFLEVCAYLVENCSEVRVFNTICNATSQNQDAARELSAQADLMIVIGGKNSSNTKQLLTICEELTKAYLIEDESELEQSWFEGVRLCGITAGASTPDWIIQKIVNKIKSLT